MSSSIGILFFSFFLLCFLLESHFGRGFQGESIGENKEKKKKKKEGEKSIYLGLTVSHKSHDVACKKPHDKADNKG